jgi:hypothetical protein
MGTCRDSQALDLLASFGVTRFFQVTVGSHCVSISKVAFGGSFRFQMGFGISVFSVLGTQGVSGGTQSPQ